MAGGPVCARPHAARRRRKLRLSVDEGVEFKARDETVVPPKPEKKMTH